MNKDLDISLLGGGRCQCIYTWWLRLLSYCYLVTFSWQVFDDEKGNLTTSVYRANFTKEDNGRTLTCRASNRLLEASAIEDFLRLDVQCRCTPPSSQKISHRARYFIIEILALLYCEHTLNRSYAIIILSFYFPCVFFPLEMESLISPFFFSFSPAIVTCFRWLLAPSAILWPNTGSIQVAPMATLRLGPTFKADSIKEGDDVYFECSIQANPDVTRLVWKHEVSRHTWLAHSNGAPAIWTLTFRHVLSSSTSWKLDEIRN